MQSVNLYTEELKPRKTLVSLNQIAVLLGVIVLVLGGVTGYQYLQLANVTKQVRLKSQDAERLNQTVEQLRAKAETWVKSEALVTANARLSKQLQKYQEFTHQLGSRLPGNTAGFSPLVEALAKQKTPELWLTRLHIGSQSDVFLLEGEAPDAKALPSYLLALREEAVFAGKSFESLEMGLSEETGRMNFSLRTGEVKGQRRQAGQ